MKSIDTPVKNMPMAQHCERCGAALAACAPQGLCPACMLRDGLTSLADDGETSAAAADPNPQSALGVVRYFGDYELLEEIARGGMGVVYKARQVSLNRLVAVKMILAGPSASPGEVRRFRAEAEAVANLQHQNIVAIHEVGEHEGHEYFSMDYVEGQNLAQRARDNPLPPELTADYLISIARAIDYAHQHGVVHRDLKPSNVLIDALDQPRITDFGLAKRLRDQADLTITGQVLGTPNYMAPEQAAGRKADVGPATDVYSLGAILYFLLTGRAPFLAESFEATLNQVLHAEPVLPRVLNPGVPRDLETICIKCLNKDPRLRYTSAAGLAEDLGRWRTGQPILARPASALETVWRWCRRYPAITALIATVLALLVTVAVGSSVHALRLQEANQRAREHLRNAYLDHAQARRWSGRPGRRFESLEAIQKAAAIRPGLDLRNEAIAAMALVDVRPRRTWTIGDGEGWGFDADLTRYARREGGTAVVCRLADDDELARVTEPGATNCYYASLSRDGRYLLAGFKREGEHPVALFDLRAGMTTVRHTNLWLRSHHFSSDGRWLVVTSHTKRAGAFYVLYDLTSLAPVWTNALPALTSWLRFSPSGDRIAIAYLDRREVEIRDPQTGVIHQTLAHDTGANAVAWSADGSRLATGAGKQAYVWDVTGVPKVLHKLSHQGAGLRMAFNPSGNLLATRAWDSLLRLWDPFDGKELLRTPSAGLSTDFTPDGRRLISWPTTYRMALLELDDARECQRLRFLDGGGTGTKMCGFSPDGRLLVSCHRDGLRLWDVASLREVARIASAGESVGAMFHPSGTNLILMCADRPIELWPLTPDGPGAEDAPGTTRWRLGPPDAIPGSKPLQFAQLDRAGKVLMGLSDRRLRTFDLEARQLTRGIAAPVQPYRSALDPTGQWGLVTPYRQDDHRAWVYEMAVGALVHTTEMMGVNSGAFSPDSRRLFLGSPHAVRCLETGSWKTQYEIARQSTGDTRPVFGFSPDGSMGAFTISQHAIRLFDPWTGRELATFEAPDENAVHFLAFSPDSVKLAVANGGPSIHVWDLRAVRRQLASLQLDWDAPPLRETESNAPVAPLSVIVRNGSTMPAVSELKFAPRDPRCTTDQIDLTRFYNASLSNSWFNPKWERNDLSDLPRGLQTLDGVAFDIRGVVQLSGSNPEQAFSYPQEVGRIPVQKGCLALHFLHANGWPYMDGAEIGEYVIHYDDGVQRTVPLIYAENIWNWWDLPGRTAPMEPGTTVAWRGRNPLSSRSGTDLLLFHFRWENPRPEVPIDSITFRSRMTPCAPFLIAITAE